MSPTILISLRLPRTLVEAIDEERALMSRARYPADPVTRSEIIRRYLSEAIQRQRSLIER